MARLLRTCDPRVSAVVWSGLGLVAVGAVWQAVVVTEVVSSSSLPSPATTFGAMVELASDDRFEAALRDTMWAWAAAVLLAIAIAVPAGLIAGHLDFWYRSTLDPINVLRSVPPAALIPPAISVFGLGFQTKVVLITFAVVWLILINTIYGVRGVDSTALKVARSMRWNQRQTFLRVVLPSAAPSIATGIRTGAAIAFVVVLSAELLGAGGGVGALMLRFGDANQTDRIYGTIVIVGAIGVALAALLAATEKRLLRWHGVNRGR